MSEIPWSRYDWGQDDKLGPGGTRRKFGAWRARISRRLTPEEKRVITSTFHAAGGQMTLLIFERALPAGVGIVRSRGRLPLGQIDHPIDETIQQIK